jgi:hypothetical protein
MDPQELETVYTLTDPNEAELIKIMLHDSGIACELDGEHQAGFTGMLQIGVLVRAWDADKARSLIESHLERNQ